MKKVQTVVFVSNFFNHHQRPLSEALYQELGNGFTFLETEKINEERLALGWGIEEKPPYLVSCKKFLECREDYERMVYDADVVIYGAAPYEMIKRRIRANKLTLIYSERPLKNGLKLWKYLPRLICWHRRYPQKKNVYLLAASAYAASDYAKFFLFRGKSYKWGYFPETKHYDDVNGLIEKKKKNSLIWVARYIDWKHPEIAVDLCRRLKQDGYQFELNMIGNGQLLDETREKVQREGLADVVHILGAMSPEDVRRHMEQAEIHIFTSDRNEGWGAVLNESMNSACVPVADRNIGSAPFLIANGSNGFCYASVDELYEQVKYLLDHPEQRKEIAKAAYCTIVEVWNSEAATGRLVKLCETISQRIENPFVEGPCSTAKY